MMWRNWFDDGYGIDCMDMEVPAIPIIRFINFNKYEEVYKMTEIISSPMPGEMEGNEPEESPEAEDQIPYPDVNEEVV